MQSKASEVPPAKRGASLRTLLIYPFVFLIVVAVILTGFLSLYNSGKAAEHMAWQLMDEIGARIEDRVSQFLDKAHLVNELNANAIESGQIDLNDMGAQRLHFWRQVRSIDYISYSYIGRADGGFFGARRLADGTLQTIATETLTGGKIHYFNTDDRGRPTTISSSLPYYDHKTRPWYMAAIETARPTWSPVFIDAGGEGLTITAATPLYDNAKTMKGVLGCSFIVSHINQFLRTLKIGESGLTFIIERSGMLVATSTSDSTYTADKKRIASFESESPRISQTGKSISEQLGDLGKIDRKQRLSVHLQGERNFVQLSPLTDHRGIDWLIVVIIPENDFMSHIKAGNTHTALLSLLALGLTVIVGFTIARRITRPILELNIAARSLADGDWSQELKIDRRDEVGELARSFNHMVKNLQATTVSRDRLAEEIEERKKVESELQKLAAVVEHSSELVNLADLDGNMIFLNEAGGIMLGIPPRDVNKHSIIEVIPDKLKSKVENEVMPNTLKEGRWEGELQYCNLLTGTLTDVHTTTFIIRSCDGETLCLANVSFNITERKKAENALISKNRELNDIIEFLPDATIVVDKDRKIIAWNRAMEEMTGIGKKDVLGKPDRVCAVLFYGETRSTLMDLLDISDKELESKYRYVERKGETLCAETYAPCVYGGLGAIVFAAAAPLFDVHGNRVGAIESIRDITESKKKEEAVLESEQQLTDIINFLPDATLVIDKAGRVIAWNRAMEEMTGIDAADMLGKDNFEYALPFYGERRPILIDLVLRPREEVEEEYNYVDRKGTVIAGEAYTPALRGGEAYLFGKASALFDPKGNIVGAIESIRDITERKRVEEALVQAKEQFRGIFENAMDGIYQSTLDGRFISVNPAFAHILGYDTPEEVLNAIKDISHQVYAHPEHRVELLRLLNEQGRVLNFETRFLRKDRRIAWIALNVRAARDRTGQISFLEGTAKDITERKVLEDRLIQVQKMQAIGTLAGGIAHDFNNILAPIIGYSELSLREIPADTRLQRNTEQVLRSAFRAKDLVKQILTFSRKTEQERRPVQISSIVEETHQMLRATLPSTIEISRKIDENATNNTAMADPTQIHQVLMNLCTNAAHAMRENGGVLSISLTKVNIDSALGTEIPGLEDGSYLRLSVSDTGHGISEEVRQRIFDPYFTTKGPDEGTGLGLAVVYGIVKGLSGGITVSSKPGEGTTFQVFFPTAEISEASSDAVSGHLPPGSGRILVVDDEKYIAEMLNEMLEQLGYEVAVKYNSADALRVFQVHHERFDLVITDQTMPHMTGTDLAKEMLRIRPDIPIILFTGFSEMIDELRARKLGIKGFLMKPVALHQLAEEIKKHLNPKTSVQGH
ncbi:MAG: PAS domain S-box protein [Syntrophobacteraceae bacterium]